MFTFRPAFNPFRHATPGAMEAGRWLASLFGATPWSGPRMALFTHELPIWVPPVTAGQRAADGVLTLSWDGLDAFLWRDGSVVFATPTEGGWNVAPAVFALANEVLREGVHATPWDERGVLPVLGLFGTSQTAVSWAATRHSMDAVSLSAMLETSARERMAEIMAAGPILDPRVHTTPDGGRFADFSPFPALTPTLQADVERLLGGAGILTGCSEVSVQRIAAPSPWKQGKSDEIIRAHKVCPHSGGWGGTMPKAWKAWLKNTMFGPEGIVPPAFRYGPARGETLVKVTCAPSELTAHRTLAFRAALGRSLPDTLRATMPKST